MGFRVTKPWGDSELYDFVLDSGTRLWRVQIKCTAVERAGGYHIQPIHFVYGKNKVVYTADDIDVLAAHVVPLDVWYVVPVAALAAGTSLRLYPDDGCKTARFEKYREGWDLFRGGTVAAWDEGDAGLARNQVHGMSRSRHVLPGFRLFGSRGFLGGRLDELPLEEMYAQAEAAGPGAASE